MAQGGEGLDGEVRWAGGGGTGKGELPNLLYLHRSLESKSITYIK